MMLAREWDRVGPGLVRAETNADIERAFEFTDLPTTHEFIPALTPLILAVVHETKFPKQQRAAQINFLADSLAARGRVNARRSRDICARQRASERRATRILQHEFYIVCSCGHNGPSHNYACPTCKADIRFDLDPLFNGLG
jgi:hypothetical protein